MRTTLFHHVKFVIEVTIDVGALTLVPDDLDSFFHFGRWEVPRVLTVLRVVRSKPGRTMTISDAFLPRCARLNKVVDTDHFHLAGAVVILHLLAGHGPLCRLVGLIVLLLPQQFH